MLNEKISVCEKFTDTVPRTLGPMSQLLLLTSGTATAKFRSPGMHSLADLGNRLEDILGYIFKHMEFTHLMRYTRKNFFYHLRIKDRAIGGYTMNWEMAMGKHQVNPLEESTDIFLFLIMVQDLISKSSLLLAIHHGKNTEWPIIYFISSQIARKIPKGPILVFILKNFFSFFSPLLLSSSGQSRKGHIPDGLATDARRHCEEVDHPQLLTAGQQILPDGYSNCPLEQGHSCQH